MADAEALLDIIPMSDRMKALDKQLREGTVTEAALRDDLTKSSSTPTNIELYACGLPDLLYQEIVSVARRVKDMTRRSSRGCGKVGSDLCFPLFHAPGKLRSAMQPALVVCNPAMSEV
jgi:hypothetical protein